MTIAPLPLIVTTKMLTIGCSKSNSSSVNSWDKISGRSPCWSSAEEYRFCQRRRKSMKPSERWVMCMLLKVLLQWPMALLWFLVTRQGLSMLTIASPCAWIYAKVNISTAPAQWRKVHMRPHQTRKEKPIVPWDDFHCTASNKDLPENVSVNDDTIWIGYSTKIPIVDQAEQNAGWQKKKKE